MHTLDTLVVLHHNLLYDPTSPSTSCRVSMMLVRSSNSDKLSNRIVHVSVQLFSNKDLALAMTEQLSLLHIMVSSLKNMMNDVLISSGLHNDAEQNKHKVGGYLRLCP